MKIAILGTRGVPPTYGGFETFAAELGVRLIARGHRVSVYCRAAQSPSRPVSGSPSLPVSQSPSRPVAESQSLKVAQSNGLSVSHAPSLSPSPALSSETVRLGDCETRRPGDSATGRPGDRETSEGSKNWKGIERLVVPALHGHKYFETVSHSLFSALDALRRDFDVVLVCNAANAFVLPLLKAARMKVAINVDGIERKRRKWNALGRAVYAMGETMSVGFADAVVADADVIARYYREHYALDPAMIPYGADFPVEDDSDVLARLGLASRNYILYVSRFEPENNPLEVVRAYERLSGAPPLVMLGKGLYAPELVRELHSHASEKVLFPGALYGVDYRTLQRNALIYVQATEVGGTHPAMIEAMASGGAVLAHGTPENREVGGDAVGYFRLRPDETLSGMISEWLCNPLDREEFRGRARTRAAERYSWDRITDRYEALFRSL